MRVKGGKPMRHLGLAALLPLAALAVSGCSDSKQSGITGKVGNSAVINDTQQVQGVDAYQGVQGTGFIAKNYLQLRAAADSCLGAGLGTISDDMFAAGTCQNQPAPSLPADKVPILGADKCDDRGKYVYEALQAQLWAPSLAGRTDTLANQLTPSYLTALAVAADVYAHTVANPQDLCGTRAAAQQLLSNCMGQFAPAQLNTVVDGLVALCSQGGVQSRAAIATIIGSAAFAAAVPYDNVQQITNSQSSSTNSSTSSSTDSATGTGGW